MLNISLNLGNFASCNFSPQLRFACLSTQPPPPPRTHTLPLPPTHTHTLPLPPALRCMGSCVCVRTAEAPIQAVVY